MRSLAPLCLLAVGFAHGAGMSIEEGKKLWSLVPPQSPAQVTIDSLVAAKRAEQKLTPNGEADAASLIRRLYLDLTGLPPDRTDQTDIPALVDQLLASRHFGERWGRHWLDAARYADSNGRDRNIIFYHAWRYRDYVIASFNAGKPYDVFLREQIAGDLMPAKNQAQRDEQLTATAFLALGSKAYEESKPEIFRMDVIDEQIETISRSVLGLSVACARCHDHKFDPIPTADYYALAGILRSTQPLYGYGPRGIKATAYHHTEWHALGTSAESLAPAALEYFRKLDAETLTMHEARSSRYGISKRIPEMKRRLGTLSGAEKDQLAAEIASMEAKVADWNVKVTALEKSVETMQDAAPPQPAWTMGARDREKIENCRIHVRGETTNLGSPVPRGFLQVISLKDAPPPAQKQSGRLELAQWLTHRDNPLTARVYVNRIWQKLFGRALVTTVDDFGVNGSKPSHPELLDYLAVRFMDSGWSVKALIKEIVLSKTYRMSSAASSANLASDPDNIYLWRMSPRLVEAEVLRDSILALSGQLDPYPPQKQFLERFHPQKNAELSSFKPFVIPAAMVDTHRSVYLPVVRGSLPEVFTLFNFAAPERPVAQRDESILPAQSLYLMNNPWVIGQARHAAQRLLTGTKGDRERITRLYALAFARAPAPEEMQRMLLFVTNGNEDTWTTLCQTVMSSAEFRISP
ncbi:DUF1549 and DUF1553 domain-containing protein [Prosthecobacter sp.]|uniref:DUF1549 and DUF1553 domain-containing protein n=1 Tax=Prosthecobacter sp. TaxID=1965333 RepID=UPI00378410A7